MAQRPLANVRGAVHDVARLKGMPSEPCNIIFVSEATLNIIQNYAIDEVTFLSRFGVEFAGGYYEAVSPEHADYGFVLDTIRNYRLEVNDMTCDLVAAIDSLTAVISQSATADCACQIGSDVETTNGEAGGDLPEPVNGVAYDEPDPLSDRKCKASNYIHQAVRDTVNELKLNRADQYGFAGLQFVLTIVTTIIGGLIAGPFGLLAGAVAGSTLAMGLGLFKASFSLTLLLSAIEADEQAAVCALYSSTSASQARTAYLAVLSAEGATAVEIEFVTYLLSNNVLNLLFFSWGDSEATIDDVTIEQSCASCADPVGCLWVFSPAAGGSGDLTKDGASRVLTATLGGGGFYRVHIELDTVSGDPGFDCDDLDTINAEYQIMSYSPTSPTFLTYHPYKWVGETRTNPGNWPVPPTQAIRYGSEMLWTDDVAFTVTIKLFPGNFQG